MENKRFIPNIQLFADGDKTFTQEEVDKIVADRLKREQAKYEKEKKELLRKHGETVEEYEERIANANLTAEEKYQKELDKIKKDLAAKDTELTTIKSNEIKRNMLSKYKLSDKFLNRVAGTTEEEIEASVKEFSEAIGEYMKTQAGGTPNDLGGKKEDIKDAELDSFEKEFSSI